ncbi:hypothetical protein [uncultured Methanolobus sp.]|uniref:hypothetical protein n=1 Tax=uncultured Methanolobus sp. TaxID=218300 RepID=UPI0029C850A6|nr:hypothetical protein [uncultured Methanolobus sp.]
MNNQIADFRDFGYEIHKNGLFWKTYVYRKDTESNYALINTFRTLMEPDIKIILENVDEAIIVPEESFFSRTSTAEMA